MTVSKRLGRKGGLTIPQAVRHAAGIAPGAPLDIEDAGDGIIIRKHVPSCIICGSTEDVICGTSDEAIHPGEVELCAKCIQQLAARAAERMARDDG